MSFLYEQLAQSGRVCKIIIDNYKVVGSNPTLFIKLIIIEVDIYEAKKKKKKIF